MRRIGLGDLNLDPHHRRSIDAAEKRTRNRGNGFRVAAHGHDDVLAADYFAAGRIKPFPTGPRQVDRAN